MIFFLKRVLQLIIVVLFVLLQVALANAAPPEEAAPVAVFPLQDMSHGRNGLNIPFTKYLAQRLAERGTKICRYKTVIAFMSNNRIRVAGQLESFHIRQLREELGAAFILLGTVIQSEDKPTPSLGVTLNLIRTSDSQTIWSYVGAVSAADHPNLLALGEATSARELEPVLGDEIMGLWPGDILNQQQQKSASVDSFVLAPKQVVPGAEVHCRVNLRNRWQVGRAPRLFLQADDQIYSASLSPGSNTYQASWIAGQEDGRFPVTLIIEWPLYGRTETVPLGYYLVDGVQPLIALDLKDEGMKGDPPVFRDKVVIVPRKLIRKPIVRWRLSFRTKEDLLAAELKKEADLPDMFIWHGVNIFGGREVEGVYTVLLEVWDEAGNKASATNRFELNKLPPRVAVAAKKEGQEVKLDLKRYGEKVPIASWRLEMWSKEGKLLKTAEGEDLPAQVGIELPTAEEDQVIEGSLVVKDILGNRVYKKLHDVLGASPEKEKKTAEEKTNTKAWVEEF